MHLSPFAISELLIVITFLPVIVYVLIKGKTRLTKALALFLFTIFIWGLGGFILTFVPNKDLAFIVFKLTCVGVYFMPSSFYHLIFLLIKKKSKVILVLSYTQSIIFSILTLNNKLIISSRYVFDSLYWGVGISPLFEWSFIIWVILLTFAHIELIQYYKTCYPAEKTQIQLLKWVMLGYLAGAPNFLVTMGFDIYPYGNFLVPIIALIIGYAILKHRFLDIVVVIRRGIIYSILITSISIIYLLAVFLLEKYTQMLVGYKSLLISTLTAFVLGLAVVPLRHRIQCFIDRLFFKGTQEEIVQQNEQLRQEITQSDKYKTLSTLASGVAHEIKNPLTSIQTFCEYLPRKLDDREFLLKFSKLVGKEVERIDGMVHELLDYSKPAPLALKKTDVNKLIQDTLNTLNSQFIKNRIEVTFEPSVIRRQSSDSCSLNIDANRIKQALLNLFLNAIESMPNGGQLTVASLACPEPSRRVSRISPLETLVIEIKDSGSGIPPEDLKHIFDPFFSRKDDGTGLGLAIVQGIMEQHHGKVRITSQVGVGTEVRLEFPIDLG